MKAGGPGGMAWKAFTAAGPRRAFLICPHLFSTIIVIIFYYYYYCEDLLHENRGFVYFFVPSFQLPHIAFLKL